MSKITRITKIHPVQFNKNKPKNANTSFSNILKKMIKTEMTDNTANNQSQVCYIHSDEINNSQMLLNDYEYKACIDTLYQKYNALFK